MLSFMFLPIGLVLEGSVIATEGTAVFGLRLRGRNIGCAERLRQRVALSGFCFGLMIRRTVIWARCPCIRMN